MCCLLGKGSEKIQIWSSSPTQPLKRPKSWKKVKKFILSCFGKKNFVWHWFCPNLKICQFFSQAYVLFALFYYPCQSVWHTYDCHMFLESHLLRNVRARPTNLSTYRVNKRGNFNPTHKDRVNKSISNIIRQVSYIIRNLRTRPTHLPTSGGYLTTNS